LIISSTRTASLGGAAPFVRNRRTLEYDAVSTSAEKVESGSSATTWNGLSSIAAYDSMLGPNEGSKAAISPSPSRSKSTRIV
jgi:hypothetical protein